ncbi:MAG: DUF4013 domain-containing protein, partial [Nanohaloarchaea archaeon]|nr:DUF4013 domain-containing protein [Candidatus Nanohaloarchaea archaeon]
GDIMEALEFEKAIRYPFNRMKGMLNVLWLFIPIFGWFALFGYTVRIVNEFIDDKFEELPTIQFIDDMKLGFIMFLKMIPFILVYMALTSGIGMISEALSIIVMLIAVFFAIPLLNMNFMRKQTVESYFEFGILKAVTENIKDYIIMILKGIALTIIFLFMAIFLVGIPAQMFTKHIFIADFYRRYVKK